MDKASTELMRKVSVVPGKPDLMVSRFSGAKSTRLLSSFLFFLLSDRWRTQEWSIPVRFGAPGELQALSTQSLEQLADFSSFSSRFFLRSRLSPALFQPCSLSDRRSWNALRTSYERRRSRRPATSSYVPFSLSFACRVDFLSLSLTDSLIFCSRSKGSAMKAGMQPERADFFLSDEPKRWEQVEDEDTGELFTIPKGIPAGVKSIHKVSFQPFYFDLPKPS